jgi:hypothetical protein
MLFYIFLYSLIFFTQKNIEMRLFVGIQCEGEQKNERKNAYWNLDLNNNLMTVSFFFLQSQQ